MKRKRQKKERKGAEEWRRDGERRTDREKERQREKEGEREKESESKESMHPRVGTSGPLNFIHFFGFNCFVEASMLYFLHHVKEESMY